MTKRDRYIKSMLNYYEINVGGTRDEKMNSKDRKDFIDRLNENYDLHTVQDLLGKIRDKFSQRSEDQDEERDPFFDSLKNNDENKKDDLPFPHLPFSMPPDMMGFHKSNQFGVNPEIEKFLDWLTNLLYSADHKVIISENGDVTNIKLQKIKKRGGRKK